MLGFLRGGRSGGRGQLPAVIEGRCWLDPRLDALADYLEQPGRPADRVAAALSAIAEHRDDPERRVQVTTAAAERLVDLTETTGELDEQARGSADGMSLLARALAFAAWKARGSGYGSGVGEDAAERFFRHLSQSGVVADAALATEPGHPAAAVTRLIAARGLGLGGEELAQRFAVARQVRPTLFAAHAQYLQAICEKWRGSHRQMLDFARAVAAQAPAGDPVGSVLAVAWAELDLAGEDGRGIGADRRADQTLAAEAAARWVSGGEAALAHPYAVEAHQHFGWFLGADAARAAFHLSRTGGRISALPWDYQRGGTAAYQRAYATAQPTGA